MHSRPAGQWPWRSQVATAVVAIAHAACSSLPPPAYPPHADHALVAEFEVPASGFLTMPSSTATRVLWQLAAEPPPTAERFDAAGARVWLYPAGTVVRVTCRCRLYAEGEAPPPPSVLFPGARSLHFAGSERTAP